MKEFFRATKKNLAEILIILVISAGIAILLPSYFKGRDAIVIGNFSEFFPPFIVAFILLFLIYFSNKTYEKTVKIPDGRQILYNEKGQITREGLFKGGKLMEGRVYTYNKNGDVLDTIIYKNGVCIAESKPDPSNF